MPTQLTKNIYQLKIPLPTGSGIPDSKLGYTLSYLIEGKNGWMLLDTGWNDDLCFDALVQQIGVLGIKIDALRWIIVTHFHGDHFGLAERVSQLSQAKILIHERDWRMLSLRLSSDTQEKSFHDILSRWLLDQGAPQEVADIKFFSPGGANLHLGNNLELITESRRLFDIGSYPLEIIWTPGHAPGHICIYDKSTKMLFSGDHVLPTITPNIGSSPFDQGEPLGDYLASLELIENLQVDLVLPGHEHIFTNFRERLEEIKEHHRKRLVEALNALQGAPRVAYEVTTRLTWDVGPWEKTNLWEKRMALLETLAHLEHLVTVGKVSKIQKNGSTIYSLALP